MTYRCDVCNEKDERCTCGQEIEALRAEVRGLRSALEFYADEANWIKEKLRPGMWPAPDYSLLSGDIEYIAPTGEPACTIKFYNEARYVGGKRAREALAAHPERGEK